MLDFLEESVDDISGILSLRIQPLGLDSTRGRTGGGEYRLVCSVGVTAGETGRDCDRLGCEGESDAGGGTKWVVLKECCGRVIEVGESYCCCCDL